MPATVQAVWPEAEEQHSQERQDNSLKPMDATIPQNEEDSGELSPLALHLLVLAGKLQLHEDEDGEPYFDPLDLAALRAAIL